MALARSLERNVRAFSRFYPPFWYTYPSTDTDQVGLGGNLILKNQSIGVASRATGFHGGIDGILG